MKKLKIMYLAFVACFFVGCETETINPQLTDEYAQGWIWQEIDLPTPDAESGRVEDKHDIQVRFNGKFLEFRTPSDFEKATALFEQVAPEKLQAWSKRYRFQSLGFIYRKAQKLQQDFINRHEGMTEKQIRQMYPNGVPQYAEGIKQYEGTLILENGEIEMNIFRPDWADLLNKDGLVGIGGHILQYSKHTSRILWGGDRTRIKALRNSTQNTENITVRPIENLIPNQGLPNAKTNFSGSECAVWLHNRMCASVNLNTYTILYPDTSHPDFDNWDRCQEWNGSNCGPMPAIEVEEMFWSLQATAYEQSILGKWKTNSDARIQIDVSSDDITAFIDGYGSISKRLYSGDKKDIPWAKHIFNCYSCSGASSINIQW